MPTALLFPRILPNQIFLRSSGKEVVALAVTGARETTIGEAKYMAIFVVQGAWDITTPLRDVVNDLAFI